MNKSIRLIMFFMVLILPMITYCQVGIGTETPTQGLEIDGSIRLHNLEGNSPRLSRQLKSDNKGNLTAQENDPESFIFGNVVKKLMNHPVLIKVGDMKDLEVELTVEIEANSEARILLMYNIPIFLAPREQLALPHFAGIKLFSGQTKNLVEGNRRFSFPAAFNGSGRVFKNGFFLEGKYVDVIRNTSNRKEVVTYNLKGYIIGGANTAIASFSDYGGEGSFGVGVFSCIIFNRFL